MRAVSSGAMQVAPSSVAMRTIASMRSPRGTPWASVSSSGDSAATSARPTTAPEAARGSTAMSRTVSSAPRPSRARTRSPGPSRRTRARWRVSSASNTTRSPRIASGRTRKRGIQLERHVRRGHGWSGCPGRGRPAGDVAHRRGAPGPGDRSEDQPSTTIRSASVKPCGPEGIAHGLVVVGEHPAEHDLPRRAPGGGGTGRAGRDGSARASWPAPDRRPLRPERPPVRPARHARERRRGCARRSRPRRGSRRGPRRRRAPRAPRARRRRWRECRSRSRCRARAPARRAPSARSSRIRHPSVLP